MKGRSKMYNGENIDSNKNFENSSIAFEWLLALYTVLDLVHIDKNVLILWILKFFK